MDSRAVWLSVCRQVSILFKSSDVSLLMYDWLVINFGSEELKKKVVDDVLAGKKFISLAISEAFAGSDVAGLRCTATKTEDGKHCELTVS